MAVNTEAPTSPLDTNQTYIPSSGPMRRPVSIKQAAEQLRTAAFPAPNVQEVTFHTAEFTSVCPISGQPDFGQLTITYTPASLCLESKSLKFLIWALREHGSFAETLAAEVADMVNEAIEPTNLTVTVHQNTRGGITLTTSATR